MAYVNGTANGCFDLVKKIHEFLTADPTLVAAGKQWELVDESVTLDYSGKSIAFSNPVNSASLTTNKLPNEFNKNGYRSSGFYKVIGKLTPTVSGTYKLGCQFYGTAELYINGDLKVFKYGAFNQIRNNKNQNFEFEMVLTAGTVYEFEIRVISDISSGLSFNWVLPGSSTWVNVPGANLTDTTVRYDIGAQYNIENKERFDMVMSESGIVHSVYYNKGTDKISNIYIGIISYYDIASDYYNIKVYYSLRSDSDNWAYASLYSSADSHLCCWLNDQPYWLFANERRLIIVTKVSNTYQTAYIGQYLPYALPSENPYPMYCAATTHLAQKWSTLSNIGSFFRPYGENTSLAGLPNPQRYKVYGYYDNNLSNQTPPTVFLYPVASNVYQRRFPDGDYTLQPIDLCVNKEGIRGCLDGVYTLTSFQISPEYILQDDNGKEYLVIGTAHLSASPYIAAILME